MIRSTRDRPGYNRHVPTRISKGKGVPRQIEVVLGVPGKLRPQIISTFGVVGRQPYAPAAFTPGEIPGTHFQRLSRLQGTWFCRKEPRKKSPVTPPGIDLRTVRLVAQRLNHYATPGPTYKRCHLVQYNVSIQPPDSNRYAINICYNDEQKDHNFPHIPYTYIILQRYTPYTATFVFCYFMLIYTLLL